MAAPAVEVVAAALSTHEDLDALREPMRKSVGAKLGQAGLLCTRCLFDAGFVLQTQRAFKEKPVTGTMRAAVCRGYGAPDVVDVRDVATATAGPDDVLIRVVATSVSSGDARIRGSHFPPGFWFLARTFLGLTRPRQPILGTELSGVVEAVGKAVTRFKPGDRVFAFSCIGMGCHAAFKVMRETGPIQLMPAGASFEDAAVLSFGGTTALYFLRDVANLKGGERVLINGASGAVGSAAVQLAHHFGAHVTGVCSAENSSLVRSLGADAIIDYRTENFAARGESWDVILDTVGFLSFPQCRPVLRPHGRLLLIAGGLGALLKAPVQSLVSGLKITGGTAPERIEDLAELKRLYELGAFRPVIDRCFPLERIADAHARVDTGRKVGSVVVLIGDPS
jgi:NADPH:quinone reductase-like Zn-dependent oxidoreductase